MATSIPPASLCVAARTQNLCVIRRFVEDAAAALGIDSATIAGIVLAVDEAVSNIITYGYQGQPGDISIEVRLGRNAFEVRLRDRAPPFDPMGVPAPDLTVSLEERSVGGLGIHLIRQTMDRVAYRSRPEGGNELLLVKRLEKNDEDRDGGHREQDCPG